MSRGQRRAAARAEQANVVVAVRTGKERGIRTRRVCARRRRRQD
jgi:hypothetical protein